MNFRSARERLAEGHNNPLRQDYDSWEVYHISVVTVELDSDS